MSAYRVLDGAERDQVIIDLLRRIDARALSVANTGKSRWDNGWQENLDALRETGDLKALQPKYIKSGLPVRFDSKFVMMDDPDYEALWYRDFRRKFCELLEPYDHIFEFGSGSGYNVAYMAQRWPRKHIVGLDWSWPAVEIIHELKLNHGLNARGQHFDFFAPDYTLEFPPNSAVLTVGALEQTGKGWPPFFDFLSANAPAFCLHIEPLIEMYDPNSLVDYTAIRAHQVRNFWTGIIQEIPRYASEWKAKRTGFGSLVLEGYSQLMWKPK